MGVHATLMNIGVRNMAELVHRLPDQKFLGEFGCTLDFFFGFNFSWILSMEKFSPWSFFGVLKDVRLVVNDHNFSQDFVVQLGESLDYLYFLGWSIFGCRFFGISVDPKFVDFDVLQIVFINFQFLGSSSHSCTWMFDKVIFNGLQLSRGCNGRSPSWWFFECDIF